MVMSVKQALKFHTLAVMITKIVQNVLKTAKNENNILLKNNNFKERKNQLFKIA